MTDEVFIFLGEPYIGKAYRKTDSSIQQYCMINEIISFIIDSINNSTLKTGIKYKEKDTTKYKYKFINGSNKSSVSVVIKDQDYSLYSSEITSLNNHLCQNGIIKKFNIFKIKKLLDNPLALLTFTNEITI